MAFDTAGAGSEPEGMLSRSSFGTGRAGVEVAETFAVFLRVRNRLCGIRTSTDYYTPHGERASSFFRAIQD